MFFFSSRRRHTRLQGDWSSDVCSSDLPGKTVFHAIAALQPRGLQPAQLRGIKRQRNARLVGVLRDHMRERAGRNRKAALGCLADRKSTRLNSSHLVISYAVFCLKKKNW